MKKNFSLIELLIVVSILAILVGLLLPALFKARMSAHQVQCLSNMKQLATAFQSYLGDNNDYYPLIAPVSNWSMEGAGDAARWYNTGFYSLHLIASYIVPGATQCFKNTIREPISNVFVCPANQLNPNNTQANYSANYFVFGNPNEVPTVFSTGKMKYPTKIFTTAEGLSHTFDYNTAALNVLPAADFENHTTTGVYQWHFRHGRRINFIFGDGHAASHAPPFFGITSWTHRKNGPFFWYNY